MGAKGTFAKFFQLFIPDASGHTFYREPLQFPASTVLARGWTEPALPHLQPAPWRVPRPPATTTERTSKVCPSDHQDSAAAINCQIQLALLASCISLAMSCCFDPDGAAVKDMPNFFSSLMRTQNMRRH